MTPQRLLAGGVLAFLLGLFGLVILPMTVIIIGTKSSASASCSGVAPLPGAAGVLDTEQIASAVTIVGVARDLKLPQRAAVIAVATAVQESGLRNLDHGDTAGPDLRGLFQQKPSLYSDIDPTQPKQAAKGFLTRLVAVPHWDTLALGDAAQAVQHSAHPELYAQWESLATAAVGALWTQDSTAPSACGGPAEAASVVNGQYALPLPVSWWSKHPDWFTKPHHDYPAADIPVPSGTTVFAASAGTVSSSPVGGSCGQGVIIGGDDGAQYGYCHGVTPLVPQGAHVEVGTPIMISGATGDATGPHLHFQIRDPAGALVCPQSALVAWAQGQSVDITKLPTTGCIA